MDQHCIHTVIVDYYHPHGDIGGIAIADLKRSAPGESRPRMTIGNPRCTTCGKRLTRRDLAEPIQGGVRPMSDPMPSTGAQPSSISDLITDAIRRAVRDAVVTHAKLGRAVPVARNGKVVWLSPEEILAKFEPPSER
jgi:hypothetical protein